MSCHVIISFSFSKSMSKGFSKFRGRHNIPPIKRILFKVNPAQPPGDPKKVDFDVKRIPKPPQFIENASYQEQMRRHSKKVQRTIESLRTEANKQNEFPKVQDYPDDLM
ncbi:unnamed protein product [Ceutorhynchus assimilis]|uniref:Uncharacterized protein n=1 Tax=Ceutorhynchus assimilis TaxID=467358 RepID=A0A9P0GS84_9CUCU|nr:unnamed protein product [Ceutorhynchus assimilis]